MAKLQVTPITRTGRVERHGRLRVAAKPAADNPSRHLHYSRDCEAINTQNTLRGIVSPARKFKCFATLWQSFFAADSIARRRSRNRKRGRHNGSVAPVPSSSVDCSMFACLRTPTLPDEPRASARSLSLRTFASGFVSGKRLTRCQRAETIGRKPLMTNSEWFRGDGALPTRLAVAGRPVLAERPGLGAASRQPHRRRRTLADLELLGRTSHHPISRVATTTAISLALPFRRVVVLTLSVCLTAGASQKNH